MPSRYRNRVRYFLDWEFHEDGRIIEPISIGLLCENGQKLHMVSSEFDESVCNDFVVKNVLPFLPEGPRFTRAEIRKEIESFIFKTSLALGKAPEFWAYYADYDWVLFCQQWGGMVYLPKGFPQYCNDLMQVMYERGLTRNDLPTQVGRAHDALSDAEWVRDGLDFIETHDLRSGRSER